MNERLLNQVPIQIGKELMIPAVNQVFAPEGKIGFDAFGDHVHPRERKHVDVSILEMKSLGRLTKKGEVPGLSRVRQNVASMLDSCPTNAGVVAAVRRLVPEVETIRIWFVLVSNRNPGPQALDTAADTFARHVQALPHLHEGTIGNIVVQQPGMLVCKRSAVINNLPPEVRRWGKERQNAQYCPAEHLRRQAAASARTSRDP